MDLDSYFDVVDGTCREDFEQRRRCKGFSEYLEQFLAHPRHHLRTAPQYCLDMFDYFGAHDDETTGLLERRWRVFDAQYDAAHEPLVGQERVQNEIYGLLQQFAMRGRSDKMILLHGPNGSSKSTIVSLLMAGLEEYSSTSEGALHRVIWMFAEQDERENRIGFEHDSTPDARSDTYAYLAPHEIAARIPCQMKDSPLFLIPKAERHSFIQRAVEQYGPEHFQGVNYDYFLYGELCPMCKQVYETLLTAYRGEWRDVVRHVQVERYFVSKRFRQAAISIEPQGNVDAGVRPLSYEPSVHLPTLLQGQFLMEGHGDLIDANHGVVEYSDFLKRPLETNKYLLTTSEKGTINLQNFTGYLDVVIFGTANEKHLSLFKRSTDFPSFKGRIELISVPYLLRYVREASLYDRHITFYSRGRPVTPHTATVASLWAILSRLRRPSAKNYAPDLAPLVARLSPIEKAMLYDHGEVPLHLKDSDRKLLMNSVRKLREELDDAEGEFEGIPGAEYEGRRGASPREMMSLLADAASHREYAGLTPMAVFDELEKLVRDSSLYEFLRQPVDNGYNDCLRFIEDVKQYYLKTVIQEVYDCIGLVEEAEYERVFQEYFQHVKAFDLGEKLFVPARGEYSEPSEELMSRIESLMSINEPIDRYRSNLITKIAAYSIDHPDEPLKYDALFPDIYNTLKQSYYQERERTLNIVEHNILRHGTDDFRVLSNEEQEQVVQTLERMKERYGYEQSCAKDVIAWVLRQR